jgi:nucleoside-diphosphate-sugar epimerase
MFPISLAEPGEDHVEQVMDVAPAARRLPRSRPRAGVTGGAATVAEWLTAAAAAVGAPAPRRVPRWLVRLLAGEFATMLMTEARGASNAKAKRELAWAPRHPSWREGFLTGLG